MQIMAAGRGRDHDPGLAAGAPPAGPRERGVRSIRRGAGQPEMSLAQALRSPQFIILLLTNFFCCATHSGPIFHTVSYAVTLRHPDDRRRHDLQRRGAGRHGRPHRLRPARRPLRRQARAGSRACSRRRSARSAYVFVRELAAFYAVAALFGFIYAGVMPLYAVLARENFPLRMMGTVIGGTAMAGSLGMATGPAGRRSDLRHLRQLRLALYRLLGHGPRRVPDRHDVPPGAGSAARAGAGVRFHMSPPSFRGAPLGANPESISPQSVWPDGFRVRASHAPE